MANEKINFLSGPLHSITGNNPPLIKAGQVLFAIEQMENNGPYYGAIYYDYANGRRVKMSQALALRGDTILNIQRDLSTGETKLVHTGRGLIFTIHGTQVNATNNWVGNLPEIETLNDLIDGLNIYYYLPQKSEGTVTLRVIANDGASTSLIPVYTDVNTPLSGSFEAGSNFHLIYKVINNQAYWFTHDSIPAHVLANYAPEFLDTRVVTSNTLNMSSYVLTALNNTYSRVQLSDIQSSIINDTYSDLLTTNKNLIDAINELETRNGELEARIDVLEHQIFDLNITRSGTYVENTVLHIVPEDGEMDGSILVISTGDYTGIKEETTTHRTYVEGTILHVDPGAVNDTILVPGSSEVTNTVLTFDTDNNTERVTNGIYYTANRGTVTNGILNLTNKNIDVTVLT